MNAPLIDFVVSTRNNRAIIVPTLEAVARQTVGRFTCTVVDGRSSDGTPDLVRERFPWVRVVVKDSDTGPSNSRNIGFRQGSAEYAAFVDSDIVLEPHWAERQIALMNSDPRIAILGGKLLHSERPDTLYAAYGVMNRFGLGWDGGRAQPAAAFNRFRECLWVNSSAMAVRRCAIEETGGFDDAMFLGCEDSDLGWRANLLGWKVAFNPEASAVHKIHGTLDPATMSRRLVYLIWKNRLRSAFVNFGPASLCRYASVFVALSVADACVRPPRREKFAALWWNVLRWRDTRSRRQWVQSRRRVADHALWPLFRRGVTGPGYAFEPRSRRFDEPVPPQSVIVNP
ncbi:MAG TPA: glycosyltransferase [Candidatus Sulfopaludibacter sp.]|nr:glycosyltransferase [Candidatus Sulfopaludibacter sp.]